LLEAIDRGNYAGGATGRKFLPANEIFSEAFDGSGFTYYKPHTGHWALDPIDGTKGFLRGGQYAVCLALIVNGEVQLGVMGCPNLPVDAKQPNGPKGSLFIAVKGEGAFQRSFTDSNETPIKFSDIKTTQEATFCESVESGHSSHSDSAKIAELLGITREPVRMDSQAKYCSISRGDGDIYLRLPVSETYVEKIWVSIAFIIENRNCFAVLIVDISIFDRIMPLDHY
jgi:3'(2'), 5'-bisphosphate nucleotidase